MKNGGKSVLKDVRIYRLVNPVVASVPYKVLVVERDLSMPAARTQLLELNRINAEEHMFWKVTMEHGEYLTVYNDQLEVCQSDLKAEETLNSRLSEGLRNVQMEAVLSLLDCWGIHSTVEFPGYLHIDMPKNAYWALGPIQEETDPTDYIWTGELHTHEGHMVGSVKVDDPTLRGLTRKLYVEIMQKFEQGVK
jgi:hypothetical protein